MKHKKGSIVLLSGLVILGLLVASCGPTPTTAPEPTQPPPAVEEPTEAPPAVEDPSEETGRASQEEPDP